MTKEVFVRVASYQTLDGDDDHMEIINRGTYYKKNDYHYVIYEEMMQGFDTPVKNMVKFKKGILTLNKKGVISTTMVLEQGCKSSCCYETPYGNMMLDMNTESVEISEEEEKICIDAFYALAANYEHLANCEIHIEITPKHCGIHI